MDASEPAPPAEQESTAPPPVRPRRSGKIVVILAVLILCLATAAPVVGQLWQIVIGRLGFAAETPSYDHVWLIFNALPEIRMQLAILGLLSAILGAALGWRTTALVAAFSVLVNIGVIVQSIDPGHAVPATGAGAEFRVMTFNISAFNEDRAAAVETIRKSGAEIVVVQEAAGTWPGTLDALRSDYRFVAPSDVALSQGMMIFSRYPILRIQQFQPISEYYPYLAATVQLPSATLTLISMHPPRPLRIGESIDRAVYFARIADHVRAIDGPAVVAGDLTATPWSRPFSDMIHQTGMISAWSRAPWLSTWPSWAPYVGIPIDHVLANDGVAITDVRLGDSAGSDHFPLIATLRLRRN
jgi:endonuclease/exonuclease/phosphatase (EEP) superfamily protein YafD